jgi:hypothetical protein
VVRYVVVPSSVRRDSQSLWARPMIFDGKGKAEISGHAGYHSHVRIYEYMYLKNILTNILFKNSLRYT